MEKFYTEQIELLEAKNAQKLVESHYHEDAVMFVLTGDNPVIANGKTELIHLFDYYINNVFIKVLSTEKFVSSDDSIMFEATIDTINGPLKVYDAMKLKDGKIITHFSGAK